MSASGPAIDDVPILAADTPTPSTLTVDEILDAVTAGIVTYRDGWDAIAEVGAPGRDEARRRICLAIAKQRGGES